ncbi:MAG TPA: hypothetical protein VMA30_22565 [Xanthobacteraceae bacterium]|nr:hypothetical protein [Xanthobacteraceae bacterium]
MKWSSWWPSWWPWLPPGRDDFLAILFAIAIALAVTAAFIIGPRYVENWSPAGFGPDWRCIYIPSSDPICLKKN